MDQGQRAADGAQPFKKSSDEVGLPRSWPDTVLSIIFQQAFDSISGWWAFKSPVAKFVLNRV